MARVMPGVTCHGVTALLQAGHAAGFCLKFRQGLDIFFLFFFFFFTTCLAGTNALLLFQSQLHFMQTRCQLQTAVRCRCPRPARAMADLCWRRSVWESQSSAPAQCSSHGSTSVPTKATQDPHFCSISQTSPRWDLSEPDATVQPLP